jgi:hypothetical protein
LHDPALLRAALSELVGDLGEPGRSESERVVRNATH